MKLNNLNRRSFLKTTSLSAASISIAHNTLASQDDSQKPNILWLTCEDISPHLGCYGDPHATTPTLDRLARNGVRYTNAYAVCGVCAPNRSCIITGVYQTTLGSHHMRCKATPPPHIKCFSEYMRDAGYYCTNNAKTDYQFNHPKSAWDQCDNKAHWRYRKNKDQPFFSIFNFVTTHESRIASEELYNKATQNLSDDQKHDPEKLTTLPPYYPDTPITRKDWARNYDLITAMDMQVAEILKQLDDDGLTDNTIVIFFSDHGIGLPRAKRWLYDSGLRVPMIVHIPEKLRSPKPGAPGSTNDELVSFVDLAPTVLNLAGIKIPDHMQGRAFLGENLTRPRDYIYGARDRMDERYDIIRAVRDKRYKYIRNYEPYKTYYQYMNTPEKGATMKEIRRVHAEGKLPPQAQLFMAPQKPLEELYDLQNDPHETNNLAKSPRCQDILKRMRKAHVKWVKETKDIGFIPEPEIRERTKKFGSEYAIARQTGGDALIERTIAAAQLPEQGAKGINSLIEALNDVDSIVRYWGAIGLGNLGSDASKAETLLTEALSDQSGSVQIAAARALCRMNQPEKALPVLEKLLKSEEEWIRLNAAIALDNIGEMARPSITSLQAVMKDNNKYVIRVANHTLNALLGTSNIVK